MSAQRRRRPDAGGRDILVHDFAGHPFQFGLSRELARRGHRVHHLYFAEDRGPKGRTDRRPDDPATLSIAGVSLGVEYRKDAFLRRRFQDAAYGRRVAAEIARRAPDLVVSGNTPPDAQKIIQRACRRRGIPFVFWLQDSFGLGVRRVLGGRLLGLGSLIAAHYEALENRMLRASDAVVLITEDFRAVTDAAGVRPERVHVIPNWAAIEEIPVRPRDNSWAREHDLAGRFVCLYSGTLGLKHDPRLLVRLARALRKDDPHARVVVASEGGGADWLRREKAAHGLDNLVLLPFQPMTRFADMLGAADVLVALIEPAAATFSVPSKVLSYLCAARPLLLAIPPDNLAARIVARAGAGLLVEPGDADAFVAAARRLRADPALRRRLGERARAHAEAHFDIARVADRFEAAFRSAGLEIATTPVAGSEADPTAAPTAGVKDALRAAGE